MKAARVVVLSVGVVLLLLLIAVGLALTSKVQTWAARRALAGHPELHATLGSVSAGFQKVQLRAVRMESNGAVLTLPMLDAELPLLSAGLNQNVQIKSLVAKGWTLDLSKATAPSGPSNNPTRTAATPTREFSLVSTASAADAAAANTAAVFKGVFADLRLPVDLSLDGLDLEGDVILAESAGQGVSRLQVTIKGGGLAAGREGSFVLDAAGAKAAGDALNVHSTITAAMDTPRTFNRLGAKANANAKGPQFPNGAVLNVDATAERKGSGEAYSVVLAGTEKQLADLKAELVSATSRIAGTWKLDLHDTDLAPFALGRTLPTFEAAGQGNFETGTTFEEVHASGRLNASADRIEVFLPELSAIGAISLAADFDILQHARLLRIERLNATVTGSKPVATVRALQSFEFNLATGELRVADPAQELLGITLNGVPVAWVRPFTGDYELSGGDLQGEFAASAREGGLALRAKAPLTVKGLSLSSAGKPVLAGVDASLNASADYTPGGWQAEVLDLNLHGSGKTLLSLNAKAGKLSGADQVMKATGRWNADLPGWTTQPFAAGQFQLTTGKAQGDFSASIGATKAIEAKLSLTNLVAATKETLPAVTAELRADMGPDGKTTFSAPLLFEQASRKSDLLFGGTLTTGPAGTTIDGRISSEKLVVEDVQLLSLIVPASEKSADGKPKGPDDKPFWGNLRGQVTLTLKKVAYNDSFEASDVGGVIHIDPTSLKFEEVRAAFGPESDLKFAGGVAFDPKATERYQLASNVALTNFDTRPAFRAVNPAQLPTIETRINVTGRMTGEGANLALLAERAHGQFEVVSKGGVFRALASVMSSEKMEAAQSGFSIVGGLLGGSTAATLNAASEILKMLSEIPFDQMSMSAERDANLNVVLKDFSLISPDLRLGGAGQILYAPGKSLVDQALDLRISLGARGRLGELLGQVKMLKAEKDNLGYYALNSTIKVGGTLAKTDNSDLNTKLMNLALEKTGVGDALNKIFGGGK
ncbi:MAG: hypothetical protein ABIZ04_19610 [Opitutus sp.]